MGSQALTDGGGSARQDQKESSKYIPAILFLRLRSRVSCTGRDSPPEVVSVADDDERDNQRDQPACE
jgi:hypothetical protein